MSVAVATQTMTAAPALARAQEATRPTMRPAALPALTGMRFFAALAVLGDHLVHSWRPGVVPSGVLSQLLAGGLAAVSLFFTLSGFILTYTYVTPAGRLRGSPRAFLVARAARLYPAYLLGLLLALGPFLALHSAAQPPVRTGLLALFMLQSWTTTMDTALNGPGWSLSCEAFFYVLFPLLVRPLAALGRRPLYVLLALCWGAVMAGHLPSDHLPLLRLPEFVAGMALGRLYALRPAPGERREARGERGWPHGRLLCLGLCAALALALGAGASVLLAPLSGLLLYALACSAGALPLLERPALLTLGEASYALYILHAPLWALYAHLVGVPPVGTPLLPAYLLAFVVLAVAASVLVLRHLETPARPLLRTALAPTGARARSITRAPTGSRRCRPRNGRPRR